MFKIRIAAIVIIIFGFVLGYFVYSSEQASIAYKEKIGSGEEERLSGLARFPFRLGLDLSGGSHLVYSADVSGIDPLDIDESMASLREVIERRVNLFGVSEPIVQVERGGIFAGADERLIVELPGVTDIEEAVRMIGQTPLLEFRLVREDFSDLELESLIENENELDEDVLTETSEDETDENAFELTIDDLLIHTGLTGRHVQRAQLEFSQLGEATVLLNFDREGRELFAEITRENVGRMLAIVLDGVVISQPVIREEIRDGSAVISGGFTPTEARELVRDLNFGALPVPIELVSTQTIGASLGEEILNSGIRAGVIGLILVAIFLLLWYRLPGLIAVVSLTIYVLIMLTIFKLLPVVLTAAGIAGFILSIGMAVDANVLIFERMKEELRKGKILGDAVAEGFARAWPSIRDGNISSIITAIILFWFGTSMVQGFALTFGIGVLVSMISAITITKTLLVALVKPSTSFSEQKNFSFIAGCLIIAVSITITALTYFSNMSYYYIWIGGFIWGGYLIISSLDSHYTGMLQIEDQVEENKKDSKILRFLFKSGLNK